MNEKWFLMLIYRNGCMEKSTTKTKNKHIAWVRLCVYYVRINCASTLCYISVCVCLFTLKQQRLRVYTCITSFFFVDAALSFSFSGAHGFSFFITEQRFGSV